MKNKAIDGRAMVLDVLCRLRNQQPKGSPNHTGFVLAAIAVLGAIEQALPAQEQWTSLPERAEDCRTLGDHLGLTRRSLGLAA